MGSQRLQVRISASAKNVFLHLQNRTRLQGPHFDFFFGFVRLSLENFLMSPKGPPSIFIDILQHTGFSQKKTETVSLSQFSAFGDFSKTFLVLKLGGEARSIEFFSRPAFFRCHFFRNCFYQRHLLSFTRNQKFCEHKGLLGIFGTIGFTGYNILIFFLDFQSQRGFQLSRMDCLLSPAGGKRGFESCVNPTRLENHVYFNWRQQTTHSCWGMFWNCKINESFAIVIFLACL